MLALLPFSMAWSWITSGLLPLLKAIPWQVWAIIGAIIGVLYYGHVREHRGYERCQAEVKIAVDREAKRQLEAANASLQEAQSRASDSAGRAEKLKEELDGVQAQVRDLKTAKTVCLPKSITDRYSAPRKLRQLR